MNVLVMIQIQIRNVTVKPAGWPSVYGARLESGRSWVQFPISKTKNNMEL